MSRRRRRPEGSEEPQADEPEEVSEEPPEEVIEEAPEKAPEPEPDVSLTGEQKMMAFRRYGSAAYRNLRSQKTKVSETEVKEEAYRMYANGPA